MLLVRKRAEHSFLKTLLNFVIVFGFVFEMPIISVITTRRISCLYAVLSLFLRSLRKKETLSRLKLVTDYRLFLSVLGLYICMVICFLNDIAYVHRPDSLYYKPHYYVYIFLYVIVFAFWCKSEFADIVDFARIYIPIMLLQACIVFVGVLNKSFRLMIYNLFYFGDDRFETTIQIGTRVGGISLYGAAGSLVMCTACMLLIYLVINKRIRTAVFILLYTIITGATAFVGRTGFYTEIGLMVLYAIMSNNVKNIFLAGFSLIISFVIIKSILSVVNPEVSAALTQWIEEIFHRETRYYTANVLFSMEIPPVSGEMIFGTNVSLGVTPSGAIMGSDSGYAKTYCAIGIVGAIFYYGAFCSLFSFGMKNVSGKRNRFFFFVIVLISFVAEIKEQFFLYYIVAWLTFTLMLLSENMNKRYENE